jgi:hypothetical protein
MLALTAFEIFACLALMTLFAAPLAAIARPR